MTPNFHIFYLVLKLGTPNTEGKMLDFKDPILKENIIDSVMKFNYEFNYKKIKIESICSKEIKLYLKIEIHELQIGNKTFSARDISFFSKRLQDDHEWRRFTREKNKLLVASIFNEVTETKLSYFETMDTIPTEELNDEDITISTMSDLEAVTALQALISISNIGSEESKKIKKNALEKIKKLLGNIIN
ncbi:hypothetical protein EHS13_25150 [Paenibacillus psychroresistens]|uniref:Uncharacterized protein n=1 Tax=Paenibacillus psychroresistens TaxID=1778678 RepID=A0A6B8RNL2_9BACL|nr:hypothetical protein [Paenibacillus psychroresistens]QGQ97941.1 hypothetical protein EHS13_25150 [Paenibacillus psychroresistens]